MPRSDDDPDFLQTYTSEGEGKSKSTRIAPLEVGRNGAPVRVFRHKELDPSALESPPQGVRFLLTDDTGELVQKNPDGTVTGVSGAPEDAEYVTTTESTALPNDTAHSTLTGADLHDPAQHGTTHEQGGGDELDVTGLSGDLADAQDPKAHQSTHQDGGADELQVDTLAGDNGAAGEVLQTDGSALSFGSVGGNVPAFEEDPSSPFENSQQSSVTITLANSSRRVVVLSGDDRVGYDQLQMNGSTANNYTTVFNDGARAVGQGTFTIPFGLLRTRLTLIGTGGDVGMSVEAATNDRDHAISGLNRSVSGPITSLTLSDGTGTDRESRLRVFTLDV